MEAPKINVSVHLCPFYFIQALSWKYFLPTKIHYAHQDFIFAVSASTGNASMGLHKSLYVVHIVVLVTRNSSKVHFGFYVAVRRVEFRCTWLSQKTLHRIKEYNRRQGMSPSKVTHWCNQLHSVFAAFCCKHKLLFSGLDGNSKNDNNFLKVAYLQRKKTHLQDSVWQTPQI